MPDGLGQYLLPRMVVPAMRRRYTGAASLAIALHMAAVLPLVWPRVQEVPPTTVEDAEIARSPEPVAPQSAEAESVTETVAAVPPEPVQTTEPPPEVVTQAAPPPDSVTPPPPEPVMQATPSPPEPTPPPPTELLRAEAPPPEPVPMETPEMVEAAPPGETVAAVQPPPPPVSPPSHPIRAAPVPRPVPRPATPRAVAPAEAPSEAASDAAPAAPALTVSRPPPSYIGALLGVLNPHKDYPSAARWRREEGIVLLRFSMRRDGTVTAWRIERSSGSQDLDGAVEQMIRRASPLPAPPDELLGDPVEITVPVRFSLR